MTRSRAQAGFSLVEVMVVAGIVAVLSAIAIPSSRALFPRIRLNSTTMVLANEIALARVRAISKSTDFCVVFYTSTSTEVAKRNSYVLKKGVGGDCDESHGTQISTVSLNGTVLAVASGFTPTAYIMVASASGKMNVPLPLVGNPVTPAVIELRTGTGADLRKRILVESTGRTSVERWSGSAWGQD